MHLGWKPWTSVSDGTAAVLDWWRANPPDEV
jgi:nucleoside-diphosphate-sugar epimerase